MPSPPINLDLPERVWQPIGESDPYARLLTTIRVAAQCSLHVEARQVVLLEGLQELVEDPRDLDSLCEIVAPDGPFETYRAFDRDYILFATPFCQ